MTNNTPALQGTKKPQKNVPTRASALRLVHFVLGLVFITAGVLKLYQLAFETVDESHSTLLLMVFSEAELLSGIWMIAGLNSARTHPWIVTAFAGLAVSNLFQGVAGRCSCGCFGGLTVNPWMVLLFDLAAIAALWAWRPSTDSEATPLTHALRLLGLILLAMVVGVASWRQGELVTVAGTSTLDGRPLEEATLTFTGSSGRIVVRTDHNGRFRMPFVRPGRYAVSLSRAASVRSPSADPSTRAQNKKKTANRSRQQKPAAADAPAVYGRLAWIELLECSEDNKIIEFR